MLLYKRSWVLHLPSLLLLLLLLLLLPLLSAPLLLLPPPISTFPMPKPHSWSLLTTFSPRLKRPTLKGHTTRDVTKLNDTIFCSRRIGCTRRRQSHHHPSNPFLPPPLLFFFTITTTPQNPNHNPTQNLPIKPVVKRHET